MTDETPDPLGDAPFTLETARMAFVIILRDFRDLRRHVEENYRLDEADRRDIARLGERIDALLGRFETMSTPAPPSFWAPIIQALKEPVLAVLGARVVTQGFLLIGFVLALLMLTDGGRELIGVMFEKGGEKIEEAGQALQGDDAEVIE